MNENGPILREVSPILSKLHLVSHLTQTLLGERLVGHMVLNVLIVDLNGDKAGRTSVGTGRGAGYHALVRTCAEAPAHHLGGCRPRGNVRCQPTPLPGGGGNAAFVTPFGYQTNVLVYQMGAYSYWISKVGLPLNLITWAAAIVAIRFYFPF